MGMTSARGSATIRQWELGYYLERKLEDKSKYAESVAESACVLARNSTASYGVIAECAATLHKLSYLLGRIHLSECNEDLNDSDSALRDIARYSLRAHALSAIDRVNQGAILDGVRGTNYFPIKLEFNANPGGFPIALVLLDGTSNSFGGRIWGIWDGGSANGL